MNQEHIKSTIDSFLKAFNVAITEAIIEFDDASGTYWYKITTPESHLLIGKNGETLSSLNYLVKKIFESRLEETQLLPQIIIDVNQYQKNRIDNLKTIAHMMAERARFFKSNVEIDPMSAFERKIVHTFLESASDIKTESTGIGRDRRVVIKYVGTV